MRWTVWAGLCVLWVVSARAAALNGWGEAVEVVLNDVRAETENYLDFDSGRVLSRPAFLKKSDSVKAYYAQMREVGADVSVSIDGQFLWCRGLESLPLCDSDWDNKSADSLLKSRAWRMAMGDPLPNSPQRSGLGCRAMYLDVTLPMTFLFETDAGGVGMAQVLGGGDDPNTMRIRYKMTREKIPLRKRVPMRGLSESRQNMQKFTEACLSYAFEHDNTLPASMELLISAGFDDGWSEDGLAYVGKGRKLLEEKDFSQIPLVYDRAMLEEYDCTQLICADRRNARFSRDKLDAILAQKLPVPRRTLLPPQSCVYIAQDNRAVLPSGVMVKLMQVARVPVENSPLWAPDGTIMSKAYIDRVSNQPKKDSLYEKMNYLAFIFHLNGDAAKTKDGWVPSDADFAFHIGPTSGYLKDERVWGRDFCTAAGAFPKAVQTTTVRLAIAAGTWETIGTGQGLGTYETDDYLVIVGPPYPPFGYEQPADGMMLGVTADVGGRNFRIVAVDKEGHECVGYKHRLNWHFDGIKYADVKEFHFQTRPYYWAEFPDVSLTPEAGQ